MFIIVKNTKPRIKVKTTIITTTFILTTVKYIFRSFTPTHDGTLFTKIVTTKRDSVQLASISVKFSSITLF